MPTWTTPPNFTTGAVVVEADLDALSNDLTFLHEAPSCRVYNSGAISVANNTLVALTFDSERFDTDTNHSTVTNTGRITFTTAGKYLVGAHVKFATNATGRRLLRLRLNGSTILADVEIQAVTVASTATKLHVSTLYNFAAADYVEVCVFQDSGSSLDVQVEGNTSPEAWATFQAA